MEYKVSAIIPTLGKRPEMLKEAIDSIKAQTMPVHEIIVVDYPDETYGNQARRINAGVKQSTGSHYFFMGDDDKLCPNFIERLMQTFEHLAEINQEVEIVTSGFEVFGDEVGIHQPNKFPLCSTIVSRAIYDRTIGYDELIPIGIDADFYFQCFELGAKWYKIPDILYQSRVHAKQYSHTGDWTNYKPLIHQKYNGKYDHV